jgi:IS4 transposase
LTTKEDEKEEDDSDDEDEDEPAVEGGKPSPDSRRHRTGSTLSAPSTRRTNKVEFLILMIGGEMTSLLDTNLSGIVVEVGGKQ